MHVRNGALRNALFAVALVAFALPLSTLATAVTPAGTVHAQTPFPPSSINVANGGACATATLGAYENEDCYVSASPAKAFNVVGTTHSVFFTCEAAVGEDTNEGREADADGTAEAGGPEATDLGGGPGNAGQALVPGCYDVSASVQDETTGTAASIVAAKCGNNSTTLTGSTVNCAGYESPICPVGVESDPAAGVFCTVTDQTNPPDADAGGPEAAGSEQVPVSSSQLRVDINPGAPHSYLITFTGYTLLKEACTGAPPAGTTTCPTTINPNTGLPAGPFVSACPAGMTYVTGAVGFNLTENIFVAPFEAVVTAPDGACQFTIQAEKKYVEITNLTLTGTGPCATGAGSSTLLFSEGLKSFFGQSCVVTVTATGIVILKSGVNCAAEPPANGTPASTAASIGGFPPGSFYQCSGDTLSVVIPNIGASTLNSGPITVKITANGSGGVSTVLPTPTVGSGSGVLCAANPGAGPVIVGTGTPVFICPTGPGTGTIQACVIGPQPDTQPGVCSNTLTFTFILPNTHRVVPYVRWAGEKQVLTKCFGGLGILAGNLVEFTLEGAGSGTAQATLIPASFGGTPSSIGGGNPVAVPSQSTVITTTDLFGCASVIVYAAGEGVVNVDAALFSTSATFLGTGPLINEHAFEIYYLKFDHLDLENIKFQTVAAGSIIPTAITTLGFSATAASFTLPGAPGSNPGTSFSVPLCGFDYLRALVHGYFELPGDPSGRPASTVSITNAPNGAVGSYVLPAGRWVLPEDWPVLATFAGFTAAGGPIDNPTASVFAWDLNSGWVFNPGGENAVICAGPTLAPPTNAVGAIPNQANAGPYDADEGGGAPNPATAVSYGPCFSKDSAGTSYASAHTDCVVGSTAAACTTPFTSPDNCDDGVTVGIGPYDITQQCTTPGPLTNEPTGGWTLTFGAPGTFTVVPVSSNSTYLPNGTLNEWDTPMPAAEISFGITGPGFLNQVNKTGLYHINTYGTDASGNVVVNGAVYPDPFYAEAIPASPLIPPVTNNGGYLWDTYGFRGGANLGPTTEPGFVAGESTTVSGPFDPCAETVTANGGPPQGWTFVPNGGAGECFVGTAGVPDTTVTLAECNALGANATWTAVNLAAIPAEGTCEIPPAPATAAGGINMSNFGPGCPLTAGGTFIPSSATSVEVEDNTGFVVGQTVEAYNSKTGATIATGLVVTGDAAGPDLSTYAVNAGAPSTLTFSAGSVAASGVGCVSVFQAIFVAQQLAVAVPSSDAALATLTPGESICITTPNFSTVTFFGSACTTVSSAPCVQPAAGAGETSICLEGSEALARALGNCVLSRGPVGGPVSFGTCEPATFLPAGSILTAAPSSSEGAPIFDEAPLFSGGGQGPYPFWQWLPNPATAGSRPQSATVYSDNHGEAVVSLETGISAQVPASGGTCPAGFIVTPDGLNCLLNLATLGVNASTPGGTAFQNVLAAIGAFTAAAPGCLQTNANGTTSPVAATTPVVGATGPGAGQICINTLGGIEFGAGAALGTTTVQAVADYPYTRGLHAPISSGTINKVFTSLFNKSVTVTPLSSVTGCTPGTAGCGIIGPSGTTAFTVTITGFDICGSPILGEPVQVFAIGNAGSVVLAPLGPGVSNGTNAATVFLSTGAGPFTGITAGTATLSLEVLNTAIGTAGLVIKVVFPLERIERFVTVIPGTTAPQTTTQLYPPGYNMVGGPPGTNFGAAEAVFAYNAAAGTYSPIAGTNISSAAPVCQGYFAYFASAASVTITVTSKAGDTATCNLAAGWNLIGNPFGSNALLPAGVTAYHFNGTTYDQVSAIPVGGAVFIFSAAAGTVTLTAT